MATSPTGQHALEPGAIYPHLDDALWAASCLAHLHPDGATIYGTTEGPDVRPESGEAYRVAVACVRGDGSTWAVPDRPYTPIYTLTKKGAD